MIGYMIERIYTDFYFFRFNTLGDIQFFLQISKLGWNTNFPKNWKYSFFSLQFDFYLNKTIKN